MKRILSCFILNFLFLFTLSQLSYAGLAPPLDKAEENFQEECLPPIMPPMHCPMRHMKGLSEFMHPFFLMHVEGLNLDEKQEKALKEIENEVSKELIRKRADKQIAEIELKELLDKEIVDLKVVKAKIKQIENIKAETRLIIIKSIENIKADLTSEQRAILKKMRSKEHRIEQLMFGKGMNNNEIFLPHPMEEKGE